MIPIWGTSTGRNVVGGVPSLLLDFSSQSYFLNGTGYAAFGASPGITFSRGTNATMIDSTGQLTFAPSNMLLSSENFAPSTVGGNWILGGTTIPTVSLNAVVAPNGTTTADAVTFPSTSSLIRQSVSGATVGVNYSVSIWLKADAEQRVRFLSNTSNGVIVSIICSVTTEWQRFSLVRVMPVGATTISLQLDQLAGSTDPGTFYLWGAQLGAVTYETAPRTYNSTTPKNLLGYTEEFNNAAWAKTNIGAVTANSVTDPNGNLNADTISDDATLGQHQVTQSITVTNGNIYTLSCYVKAGTAIYPRMALGGNFTFTAASFDLSLGTVKIGSSPSATIVSVGNGWFRISINAAATATASGSSSIGITNVTGTAYSGTGDTLYIWGAQLSDSASVDPYVYNPAAALTSTAYYGPRFDYDPVTLAPLGLLIEEARTNLLLNSDTLSTQIVTTTAQAYTLSFYGTGTVTLTGTSIAGPLVGTGVFPNRVSLTFTATAGALTLTVSGTVSNAQFEAGSFATSYIPTAGASVTRSADVATMVGNNFSNWYNQTTGTLAVAFDASANGFATYVSASNGTITQNSTHIDNDTGIMRAAYYSGSTLVAALGLGTIGTVGATNKIATAYAVNDFAASRNGGTVATDTLGAVPVSLTQLNIGADDRLLTANYTSNHIKSISYYNTRLTNTLLQAITA